MFRFPEEYSQAMPCDDWTAYIDAKDVRTSHILTYLVAGSAQLPFC